MAKPVSAPGDWYDFPRHYDIAMRGDTAREARFIEEACRRYLPRRKGQPLYRLLEPACGTGRLLAALARRGHDVVGYDSSPTMIDYATRRLRRIGTGKVVHGDMRSHVARPPVDAAFSLVSTLRHLSYAEAQTHLESVAASLRPGGIYLLGLILIPADSTPEEGSEQWNERFRGRSVTVRLRVLSMDLPARTEVMRTTMTVREPGAYWRVTSDATMHIYTPDDMRRLLGASSPFEVLSTFDFWFEIDRPETFGDRYGDVVFVLRKRG